MIILEIIIQQFCNEEGKKNGANSSRNAIDKEPFFSSR
jgi:hypothetical protein